jgi:hypothetical protein
LSGIDTGTLSNDADALGQRADVAGQRRIGSDHESGGPPAPLPGLAQSLPAPLPPLDPNEPDPFRPHRFVHPKRSQAVARRKQRFTTPAMVARYMGVDPDTVRNWIRRLSLAGKVTHHAHYTDDRARKTGRGRWRIFESDLTVLLRALRAKPPYGFGEGFWQGKA